MKILNISDILSYAGFRDNTVLRTYDGLCSFCSVKACVSCSFRQHEIERYNDIDETLIEHYKTSLSC